MRGRIRAHLTYANVMATIALFIALGGVAYAAGTIGSGDVINNSLRSADLKDDAAVQSADVRDDSLTGNDIVESSLGEVPSARLGGLGGDTGIGPTCDPRSDAFITCAATDTINLAAPTRVLILGQVDAFPNQVGVQGRGKCHVGSNLGFLPESETTMFVQGGPGDTAAMSGVTGVVGPGPIKFGLDCTGEGIEYLNPHLSFVELSPGSP